jgi:hypothetical protein
MVAIAIGGELAGDATAEDAVESDATANGGGEGVEPVVDAPAALSGAPGTARGTELRG